MIIKGVKQKLIRCPPIRMAYANGKMNGSTNYSASYSNYVEINETIKSTVNGDIAANNFAEFICQKLEGVYHERVVLVSDRKLNYLI